MPPDLRTLIWLFPIAFMLHDFEELILGEPWLRKNASTLQPLLERRLPAWLAGPMRGVLHKSGAELALPIGLIFLLTCLSSFLALACGHDGLFLAAASLFFLHGFMHIGQALLLRGYIPAVITSALIAIPYGALLFWRLLAEGVLDLPGLLFYFLLAILFGLPGVLFMHRLGEVLYPRLVATLIRPSKG